MDDEVRWFKSDEHIKIGAIGHIVGFKPNGYVYLLPQFSLVFVLVLLP